MENWPFFGKYQVLKVVKAKGIIGLLRSKVGIRGTEEPSQLRLD